MRYRALMRKDKRGKRFGATDVMNSTSGRAKEMMMEMTQGNGVDTVIDTLGIPVTFELYQQIVAQSAEFMGQVGTR